MPQISYDEDGMITLTCITETPFGSFPCTNERMTAAAFEEWLMAMIQDVRSRRGGEPWTKKKE